MTDSLRLTGRRACRSGTPALDHGRLYAFENVPGPVVIDAGDRFLDVLGRVAPTWRRSTAANSAKWLIRVRQEAEDTYRIETSWSRRLLVKRSTVSAVCAFLVDLVYASLDGSGRVCLHCAAVELGGGLIVFPNTYRAGKSTLVAALAATGVRVHADDLMPLSPRGEGIATGINPRLRLPLPESVPPRFRAFVARHPGPGDSRYQYLGLPETLLSPHGLAKPVRAIVVLRRTAPGGARLDPRPASDAARRLILQHFQRDGDPSKALDRLLEIVARIPCFELQYDDLDNAARLLKRTFATAPSSPSSLPGTTIPMTTEAAILAPRHGRMPAGRLVRRRGIAERTMGGMSFLAAPEGNGIFELNAVGLAIWEILAEPASPREVAGLLAEAFPAASPREIRRDVADLMRRMWTAELLHRHPKRTRPRPTRPERLGL